jgi:TonB family protein
MRWRVGIGFTLSCVSMAAPLVANAGVKFASLPTAEDMAGLYPEKAVAEQIVGRATVSCAVTPEARLTDCQVTSETPEGYGFGAAAVAAAQKITLAPGDLPVRINLPVRFEPPMRTVDAIFAKMPGDYPALGPAGPYYPERAARMGAQGFAILACHLAATGYLSGCKVLDETPRGFGFPDAAMKMMERKVLTAAPRLADGIPVADELVQVQVPFQFRRR